MSYELIGYRESDLVKLDILLNGKPLDALSLIIHKEKAGERGRALAEKLQAVIPRQFFDCGDTSRHRTAGRRAQDGQSDPKECHREMLRRGHHP